MSAEPSWEIFKNKTNTPEDTFENNVAKLLFSVECKILPKELICSPGYAGIECQPIETANGWAGFQAKYSHDGKQNIALFKSLEHAYSRKTAGEYQLDIIYCYSSGVAPRGATKELKAIEKLAADNGVKLVWRFRDQILEMLEDEHIDIILRH